jgi:ribosomal protein S15P/S13E
MQNFIYSLTDFFAPRHVQKRPSYCERPIEGKIVECVNECGEKRYIQMEPEYHPERKRNLEILITKCKRLVSFVERTEDMEMYDKLQSFIVKVRQAMYRGDDIAHLFNDFEEMKSHVKRNSMSFSNLSRVMIG